MMKTENAKMTGKDRPHGLPLPLPGLMAALFAASWAGLLFLVLRTIGKIWPAMTIFDAPSLIAGALLIPMAFFLIQSLFHLPRGLGRAFLVRVRPAAPCFMILFPVARRTERGPALSIVAKKFPPSLMLRGTTLPGAAETE